MNSILSRSILCGWLLVMFSACASHELVRPGVTGIHSVTTYGGEREFTSSLALSQANCYCTEVEKTPSAYILSEKTSYMGSVKEQTYRKMKTASNVSHAMGADLIGISVLAAADGGYNTKMTFTCKQRYSARR